MEVKLLEVRDAWTFIPIIAIKPGARSEEERYLLSLSGYGRSIQSQEGYILIAPLPGGQGLLTCNCFDWECKKNHTLHFAHKWLDGHWEEVKSGDVVDVEFLQGKTSQPKVTQRITDPIY